MAGAGAGALTGFEGVAVVFAIVETFDVVDVLADTVVFELAVTFTD